MTVATDTREIAPRPPGVVGATLRLLTFRLTRAEFHLLGRRHLLFGLLCAWIVGAGRYWDNPRASLLQHLGVGSVVYVFALSLLLWLVVAPLRPREFSYRHVCTFVALVSPPAILYAIPVEKFFSLDTASSLNVWFLAAVALWRVALLVFYLSRHARLRRPAVAVAALLPLTLIVTGLALLNLEHVVFNLMGGLEGGRTADDAAYAVLWLLTLISFLLFVPLLLGYVALIVFARRSSNGRELSVTRAGPED